MREARRYPEKLKDVFDTHAHLYDSRFEENGMTPEMILRNAASSGVTRILIPADNETTSLAACEFVRKYDGTEGVELFCSVGVHPHEASSYSPEVEERLLDMIKRKDELKIRAIGEIGLDYYYDLSPRDVQKEVYRRQLELAYENDMPIILHERDATGDSIDILRGLYKEGRLRENPGVCHCCTCSPEIARELVKMGFYIGFDGPLTFKNNKKTPSILENVPDDRIVIETDSPYLTPEPNRGLTNEPANVVWVADKIASLRGRTTEEIIGLTTENAMRLYELI
ncbi:MAG: TatD family hydrolase [Clostridiales bacterium]|nr:TatD family hydrolase [Clostridiales bacterium]